VRTNSLLLDGTIDVRDNAMILDYAGPSPLSTIQAAIASGYAGGAWNGPGINSATAAAASDKAVGFAESSVALGVSGGTFKGQSVDGDALLIRFTYYGDSNVDGVVDTVDFNLLASNFSQSGKSWQDGDYNFDGTVDTVDFNLLASNFGKAPLPSSPAELGGLVPEPTAVSLLAIGAIAGLSRRRRNWSSAAN